MGVVYKALDLTLDRAVAVKTLPRLAPEYGARLRREARVMASVSHPNLAVIFGAETWQGQPMLIFEFFAAGTLGHRLNSGTLKLPEVLQLGILLSGALEYVHGMGILHRDIKPTNIGYSEGGEPKLLDFGLAKILREFPSFVEVMSDDTEVGSSMETPTLELKKAFPTGSRVVGTPAYLAPEAIRGDDPGVHIDLWGLSVVLFEALGGSHPFASGSRQRTWDNILDGTRPDILSLRPDCPAEVKAFIDDSLAVDRRRRPATAKEFRSRLEEVRHHLDVKAA